MKTFAVRIFQLNIARKILEAYLLYVSYSAWVFLKTITARFFHLSIAKKMLLGYLLFAFLTVAISLFILSRLEELNRINDSILKKNIPLVEITNKMIDNLLAQDLYGHRSLILQSPDLLPLLRTRSEEFKQMINKMDALSDKKDLPIDKLAALHSEYHNLFLRRFEPLKNPSSAPGERYDQEIKDKQEQIIQLLQRISVAARQEQNQKSRMTLSIGHTAFRVAAALCLGGILLGILVAMLVTRNISGPIHQLKLSTKEISEGKFNLLPQIRKRRDEVGDLYFAFQEMVKRLKSLEEMYLDASPLTHLPGGVAIETITKKRLAEGFPLAFCLIDLGHFKAFNDRYGYARGNEVILATAGIITQVVEKQGRQEDFVGHIGGDDFVIITVPDSYEKICRGITEAFDKRILDFYDPEDRERGCIVGKTRRGKEVSFPIMTISIAVVTNRNRALKSHIQVGEIAAEMKTYAKSFARSIYVVDRRGDEAHPSQPSSAH